MEPVNIEEIKKILNHTLADYPVAFAYVFGSSLSSHRVQESDVDVALGFSKPVSDGLFYEIFKTLNSRLSLPTEKLDLKNFADLPLLVRFRVIRDGKLVYLKDEKIHRQMAVKTIDYYHDEAPIIQRSSILSLKQMASK